MHKKGQITAFIIIGIIILGAIAMVLYFRQAEIEELPREAVEDDVRPVQLFVEECIQRSAVPGIFYLGEQGGYIEPPQDSFNTELHTIAFGFKNERTTLPAIQEMQQQLSKYLREFLPICTNSFEDFEREGMEIKEGNISVETRIFNEEVVFMVDYPLTIIKDGATYNMQNFISRVPVRLGNTYNIAQQVIRQNQNGFTLNRMLYDNARINLMPSSDNTMVMGILDEESVLFNRTFVFMFAYEINSNHNPEIKRIYNPVFEAGETIYLKITAEDEDGDEIKYSSNSTLFSPNPLTGEISTTAPSAGNYKVKLIAEDGKGGRDEEIVIFRIL